MIAVANKYEDISFLVTPFLICPQKAVRMTDTSFNGQITGIFPPYLPFQRR